MKNKSLLKVGVLVLCSLLVVIGVFFFLPDHIEYRITETYKFQGDSGVEVNLGVLLPRDGPYQQVKDFQIAGTANHQTIEHPDLLEKRFHGVIPAEEELTVTINYRVYLTYGYLSWEEAVREQDLAPQPFIEADHPKLVERASQLTSGNTREDAYEIYKFVAEYLEWPEGTRKGVEDTALSVYESGIGVCGDFANLMVALCRAAEIPARSVRGLVFKDFQLFPPYLRSQSKVWDHPGGAHGWVEFFSAGVWEVADPSWAGFIPHLQFGRADGKHLYYGEVEQETQIYNKMLEEIKEQGDIVGAMSMPLRFAASVSGDVQFTPETTVHKGWDGNWVGWFMVIIVLIVALLLRIIIKK